MPSSNKFSLGLNNWSGSDTFSFDDIKSDNRIINDEIVALKDSHINISGDNIINVTDNNDNILLSFNIDNSDKTLSVSENGLLNDISLSYSNGELKLLGKDNTEITVINLPEHQILSNAELVIDPTGQEAGTYIQMDFTTTSGIETIYINVHSLVDVYTSGNAAIVIDNTNDIISLQIDPNGDLEITENGLYVKNSTGENIPTIVNRNLLHNSDFRILKNIVAQDQPNGASPGISYSGNRLFDRWRSNNNGKVTIGTGTGYTSSGITFMPGNGQYFYQTLDNTKNEFNGRTFTLSGEFKLNGSGGKVFANVDGTTFLGNNVTNFMSTVTFTVPSNATNIYVGVYYQNNVGTTGIMRIKLEEGNISTIEYESYQDYETELRKCQKYFLTFNSPAGTTVNNFSLSGASIGTSGGTLDFNIPIPTPMYDPGQFNYVNMLTKFLSNISLYICDPSGTWTLYNSSSSVSPVAGGTTDMKMCPGFIQMPVSITIPSGLKIVNAILWVPLTNFIDFEQYLPTIQI